MKYLILGLVTLTSVSAFAGNCYIKEKQEIFRPQDHYWSTGTHEHRIGVESLNDCLETHVKQFRTKLGKTRGDSERVCINEEIGINVQCEYMNVERTLKEVKFIYSEDGKRKAEGYFKH
jgi:hypothetical protein